MSNKKQKKYYAKRAAAANPSKNGTSKATASVWSKKKQQPDSPLFDKDNPYEIFTRIFLIAMAVLFPLVMGEEKYGNITHFKNMAFYVIAALAFSALIVTLIVKILGIPADQFGVKNIFSSFNAADIAVSCYWVFLLISALLSDYKTISFFGQGVRNDGLIIQTFYVATYFVLSRLIRLHKFDLNIYCYGATVVAVLVMLHFFGIDLMDTGFSEPNWESGLLFLGPMGNINLTSYFVTVALILAAALYITERHSDFGGFDKHGIIILCCFGMMLWAELNLNTDAGIVALGVAFFVSLPLILTSFKRLCRMLTVLAVACGVVVFDHCLVDMVILKEKFGTFGCIFLAAGIICLVLVVLINTGLLTFNPSRKTMLISSLAVDGAAIAGAVIAAFVAAKTQTSGVLYELGQMLFYGNFNDKFGSKRIFTWKRTVKLAGKHPVFGSGPDTFCNVFNEVYGDEASEFFGGKNLDKAHNEYLQLLICSGITGLGSFLAFIGSMVVQAFKRATDNPMLVCCAMGVVGYAVHAFFGYSLPINSPLMWVLFGITGAAMRVDADRR